MAATSVHSKEPIFSAEQIRIPDGYPDVVKDYAKFIIRTQPKDLILASAEYFHNLVNNKAATPSTRLSEFQLESLYARLTRADASISVEDIRSACGHAQIPPKRVDEFLSLGSWSQQALWIQFWALAVASATNDFLATVELALELMSGENSKVQVPLFLSLYKFLAERDANVAKSVEPLTQAIGNDAILGRAHVVAAVREVLRQ